jgi:hypothetical protein
MCLHDVVFFRCLHVENPVLKRILNLVAGSKYIATRGCPVQVPLAYTQSMNMRSLLPAALEELNLDGTNVCDDDLILLAPLAGSLQRLSVWICDEDESLRITIESVQKAKAAFERLGGHGRDMVLVAAHIF